MAIKLEHDSRYLSLISTVSRLDQICCFGVVGFAEAEKALAKAKEILGVDPFDDHYKNLRATEDDDESELN